MTTSISDSTAPTLTDRVFERVTEMVTDIFDAYGVDELDITMDSTFHDDLEMESIDLVTLAGALATEYGAEVHLAEYLAEKSLDEVIDLTVGDVVRYVVSRLES